MLGRFKSRIRRVPSAGNARSDSDSSHRGGSGPSTPAPPSTVKAPPSSAFMERTIDYGAKVEELAAFDSCVEACDALAAASSYAQSTAKRDKETGLLDCSVMVSPDGDLLLLPQDSSPTKKSPPVDQGDASAQIETHEDSGETPLPVATSSKIETSLLDAEFSGHDDYESAVVMGNDLRSDKSINGFSAMGWSPSATTLAVRQTEQTMRQTATFVETLILSNKEAAARASDACDQFRATTGIFASTGNVPPMPTPLGLRSNGRNRRRSNSRDDYDIITALDALPLEYGGTDAGPNRVGPMVYSGGTLHTAMVALEQYHSVVAENDSNRLRMASKSVDSQVGVLPALHHAAEQATERAYNREKALREMNQRIDSMEIRLSKCKVEAKRRWDAVHNAEDAVTRIVEDRMLERSRQRERKRMEQLREEEEQQGKADLGATPGEIWDIVSAVAESMEDGSFAPTGLPDAPVAGPRDKSSGDENKGVDEVGGTPSSLPLASRIEIEQECGLPGLRAAAMAANEQIEDTAQSLLNLLSTLDTTRRSARVAAETCLLSACHSQAAALRSLVMLEKTAIEDRLENIKQLERIVNEVNVRSDLDKYITADKKERGGVTRLGEDDDGGVASALAVLSSHVDGSMGFGSSSRISTEGWNEKEEEEAITPEQLEDAVDALFSSTENLQDDGQDTEAIAQARAEYDSTVEFLCKTASDKSSPSRSRRSTICYALNSKRSSNAALETSVQFEGLCKVFRAVLSGCDNESGGVSNAKMCMMLSQTFYMKSEEDDVESKANPMGSPSRVARNNRIFVKNRLINHPLWSDEEFWDQALYQCVTESLTHSGVMSNFDRGSSRANRSEWAETNKMKWHDLTAAERSEAASQVHAVVFAQLGALAHSMVEFGCGLERSCSFVRRMSIRNQLPVSQRSMLLKHLMKRDGDQ